MPTIGGGGGDGVRAETSRSEERDVRGGEARVGDDVVDGDLEDRDREQTDKTKLQDA